MQAIQEKGPHISYVAVCEGTIANGKRALYIN